MAIPSQSVVYLLYVAVFALTAVICFGSLMRARRIANADTRRGLVALLLTSGMWATAHVGFLTAPAPEFKLGFYYVGLVVGLSTVGPWLYFCSAFTGRTLHRSPLLQRLAIGLFLTIVAIKLTNPIHQLYFQTEFATTPFPYLAIQNLPLHWITMGLAYALATIGYFMLFELFWQVGHNSKPFAALVALTGLPVLLDIFGFSSSFLIDITYEPLGVAAFAVGVLFVYLDDFQALQLIGEHDDPVIVLDDAGRIRDYNTAAHDLFPTIDAGDSIDAVIPEITAALAADDPIIRIDRIGGMYYFQVAVHPFTSDQRRLGRAITLTDVTAREEYRTELERQNDRLEQFASMVSHDLRNPLNVAHGHIELAREAGDSEHLETATTALERMQTLIEDVLSLARQGQPISAPEEVALSTIAKQCWGVVETREATLTVDSDFTFQADSDRLQQLLENLFRNAIDHGRDDVEIRVGALNEQTGFFVADNGPGIPEDTRDEVFESGYSTAEDGTGFGLAIVSEIVEAHGWKISVTGSEAGGARFEITGCNIAVESNS